MTENERDNDIAKKLLIYAKNEKTAACLRERLREVARGLAALNLDTERHPKSGEIEQALLLVEAETGDTLTNLGEYKDVIHERSQLQRFLRDSGYAAILKE